MRSSPRQRRARPARSLLGGRLTFVPGLIDVPELVDAVHGRLGAPRGLDPREICERFGWAIRSERLAALTGGQQAALLPRWTGGFTVVVDPDLTPAERAEQADALTVWRFRVAHELGHTLFYSETAPPRRAFAPSRREEDFCDAFARTTLGVARPLQPV